MKLETNGNENFITVTIDGNIEMTTMKPLKDKLLDIASNSDKNIMIDFSKVEYLDSSGLGVLLTVSKILKSKGKKVKLINIPQKVAMVMQLSSVKHLIEN